MRWYYQKGPEIKSVREDVEKREPSCTDGGNVNWYSLYIWKTTVSYGKQYGDFFKKLRIELLYDLSYSILFLGIYPKNMETLIQEYICTPMFIAALFTSYRNKLRYGDNHSAH